MQFTLKTAILSASLVVQATALSLSGTAEGDARAGWLGTDSVFAELHLLALSGKATIQDKTGDRLILFGLAEAHNNATEIIAHEAYVRYKGPMSRYNLTTGRFTLPYGLLASYTASRLLFSLVEESVIGVEADNGAMLSGVLPLFDYAIVLSQGIGAHHPLHFMGPKFGMMRFGRPLGEMDDFTVGLSFAGGKTADKHDASMFHTRTVAGMDVTTAINALMLRMEANAGYVDDRVMLAGAVVADYALNSRMEANAGLSTVYPETHNNMSLFSGLTFRTPWFLIRGGYQYGMDTTNTSSAAIQLYRQLSVTR